MRHPPYATRIVTARTAEAIDQAIALLPPVVRGLVGDTPFWEGDVTFGGFWDPAWGPEGGLARCWWRRDGRSFPSVITLPSDPTPVYGRWPMTGIILHELGHALLNRIIRPHLRRRVFWSFAEAEVKVVPVHSGLLPALTALVPMSHWHAGLNHHSEQLCEAFRIWLSPRWALQADGEPERFYWLGRGRDHAGYPIDNRRVLAWFNALEGWPLDRPPRALRCPA